MLNLNIDMSLFYNAVNSTFESIWPVIAPVVAIGLVGLVMGGIITIFRKWQDR